ncbi:MAG: biopolymer transporter ExbD [Planctomycetota bacterium]
MGIRLREESTFTLELTPMIDVVFLLIVFFLLATTFQAMERELAVSVPKSQSGDQGGGPDPVVINVLEDGTVVVGGNRVDLDQLHAILVRRVADEPATKALIRADKRLQFDKVIAVADICRRANAALSFATLERSSGQ